MTPVIPPEVILFAQEQVNEGPQGPEFGKAAPVGLLVIVGLLVVVLLLGYFFNRRMRKMNRRRNFAEAHGLDPFDIDTIDRRMAQEAAVTDTAPPEQESGTDSPGGDRR